jgi:hypothetical protein
MPTQRANTRPALGLHVYVYCWLSILISAGVCLAGPAYVAGRNDPAYPAVARIVNSKSNDSVQRVEITVLCEAADGPCAKFRSDIRDNVEQLSKMMAGDPFVRCRTDGHKMKCGAVPVRKQTNQQIYVRIEDGGTCAVDNVTTPCLDVGKQIRAQHPSDDPRLAVCASAKINCDAVGSVLRALNEQDLPIAFGCPPHAP